MKREEKKWRKELKRAKKRKALRRGQPVITPIDENKYSMHFPGNTAINSLFSDITVEKVKDENGEEGWYNVDIKV